MHRIEREVVTKAAASKLLGLAVFMVAAAAFVFVPGSAGSSTAVTLTYPSTGACAQSPTGLASCIASATDGSTITIKPGTYYEHGTAVGHSVTVTGSCGSPSSVVIDQATVGNGFNIQAPNVTIECLKLRLGGSSFSGIVNTGAFSGLHVAHVVVHSEVNGISQPAAGTSGLSVTSSTFLGINGFALLSNTLSNATLTGNTFGNASGACVELPSLSTSTISNNTFGPCGATAVEIDAGATNTISGNKFATVTGRCLYVESNGTTMTKNTFNGCNGGGILVDAGMPTITSNTFSGEMAGDTIQVDCGNSATISGNVATGGNDIDPFISVCQQSSGGSETITNNTEMSGLVLYGIQCSPCDAAVVTANKILGGGEGDGILVIGLDPTVNTNTVGGGWATNGIFVICVGSCTNAQVEKNVESGAESGYGYDVESSGCASFPCMTISGNASTGNREDGFYILTSFANITGNTATENGYSFTGCRSPYSGFDVESGSNHLSGNTASGNVCDGFFVNAPSTTLSTNTATGNFVHGFQIEGNLNSLDHDTSTGNFGDGFNNDGTNTSFTSDKASGNRQDCTNDTTGGETATISANTGNTCADHTNFGITSTLTGW